jgi:hypothetical protein
MLAQPLRLRGRDEEVSLHRAVVRGHAKIVR